MLGPIRRRWGEFFAGRFSFVIQQVGLKFVYDSAATLLLRGFNALAQFASTVLLARVLGADGYGIYAFSYSIILLLTLLAESGVSNLVIRETAKAASCKDKDLAAGVMKWASKQVGLLSLIVIFIVGPFLVEWRGGSESESGLVIMLALLLVPVLSLGSTNGAALRGHQYIIIGQIPDMLVRPGLFLLFVFLLYLLSNGSAPAHQAILLFVVSSAVALVTGFFFLNKYVLKEVGNISNIKRCERKWASSSFSFALMAGLFVVINQASTIMLGVYATDEDVGVYRVAVQTSMLVAFGLEAINQVAAPRFASLYSQGRLEEIQSLCVNVARIATIFSLLAVSFFVFFGRDFFVHVFGADFTGAFSALVVLMIGQLVNSLSGSVGYLLNMTGNEKETVKGVAYAVCVNVALNIYLIPAEGVMGASVSTALSVIIWNLYLWWRAKKILGVNSSVMSF